MGKANFGMIGLGTMGRNFLLNIGEHGFSGVGYDLDAEKRRLLLEDGAGKPLDVAADIPEFLSKLAKPRNIMLLVPAGKIVDSVINELLPHLEEDDLVIDGGNSHFTDTERREALLIEKGIEFMGIGVSGGEEGARHGASIMPGGRQEFYDRIEPVLQAVAAKVNDEPCVAFMGKGSAGHFVKMVHNGIEYGLMQILAETYDFMHRVLHLDYRQMSDVFAAWNTTELNSFLVEITSEVLKKVDADTDLPLVEVILDKAAQKGTGKWTSQAAMDLGVPVPTIDSAVSMRQISAQKETRVAIAQKYGYLFAPEERQLTSHGEKVTSVERHDLKAVLAERSYESPATETQSRSDGAPIRGLKEILHDGGSGRNARIKEEYGEDIEKLVEDLKNTLLSAFIVTYAQGMSMLQTASQEKEYGLDLGEIAKIWRGGCIIRSALLEDMRKAYADNPELSNLLMDEKFARILNDNRKVWHTVTAKFAESRVSAMCLSSALAYFDAFRAERLPANLIQAQRDYFGAHTYQRTDKEGVFHTPDWK